MSSASRDAVLQLLKGDPEAIRTREPGDATGSRKRRPRIRCPRCSWEPSRHDLWMCVCLHAWHTFDTRGVCPGCGLEWSETQCPRCSEWSPHDDWYEDEPESPQ